MFRETMGLTAESTGKEQNDTQKNDARADLEDYLNTLKEKSSLSCCGRDDDTNNEDRCIVVFPDNFDEVVDCMTRRDIQQEDIHSSALFEEKNKSNSESWHKHALSEAVSGVGVFKEYEEELKRCDDSDQYEKLQRAFSKIEQLDRLIKQKEIAHEKKMTQGENDLDIIKEDAMKWCCQYEEVHGVPPPGGHVGTPTTVDLTDYSESESSVLSSDYLCFPGRNKNRFFMTDAQHSQTSNGGEENCSTEKRSFVESTTIGLVNKDIPNEKSEFAGTPAMTANWKGQIGARKKAINRNKALIGKKGKKSLTATEDERVAALLGSDAKEVVPSFWAGDESEVQMIDIDERLEKAGILGLIKSDDDDNNNQDEMKTETSPYLQNITSPSSTKEDKNIVRKMARKRAEKEKEKQVNNALKIISCAPLQLVARSDYWKNSNFDFQSKDTTSDDPLHHPLKEDDIEDTVRESKHDLDDDDIPLAKKENILLLLAGMRSHLERQAKFRKKEDQWLMQQKETRIKT